MVPLTKNGGDHKGNNMKKIAITTALAAGFVAIAIGSSASANALHRTRVAVAPHGMRIRGASFLRTSELPQGIPGTRLGFRIRG